MILKILTIVSSTAMIGFGVWHFFVPKIWNWYSYIKSEADELVAAVRAVNVFFSLSLVLIGAANIIFAFYGRRFGLLVMLSVSNILWLTRVIMQIVYPQGSKSPVLRYGMLCAFIAIFLCFLVSLILTLFSPVL